MLNEQTVTTLNQPNSSAWQEASRIGSIIPKCQLSHAEFFGLVGDENHRKIKGSNAS